MNWILRWQYNFSVKIILGAPCIGKTTLLKNLTEVLLAEDVAPEEIIFIDCSTEYKLKNFQQLYDYVSKRTAELDRFFLLLDDADCIAECEKAINALFVGTPAEIFLTCSNYNLVQKISNLLPKNCDVLTAYPPAFDKYAQFFSTEDSAVLLQKYLRYGSLPATIGANEKFMPTILRGLAYEMMFSFVAKNSLQNPEDFHRIIEIFADYDGVPLSSEQLTDIVTNKYHFPQYVTDDFMYYFLVTFEIFIMVPRYDIEIGKLAGVVCKFYCIDNGLLNVFRKFNAISEMTLIENAVCIELLRRDYFVYFGIFDMMDISFVGLRGDKKIFIQIMPPDGSVSVRQITLPLRAIPDDGEKILISMNDEKTFDGVRNITLQKFLAGA